MKTLTPLSFALSEIDRLRFGFVTAKATFTQAEDARHAIQLSRSHVVSLLIARVPTHCLAAAQELENRGSILTDTLVQFVNKRITPEAVDLPAGYALRLATKGDAPMIELVAAATFRDYLGHYHADPALDRKKCDQVYSSWAGLSCLDKTVADAVLIIERESEIAAFATLKFVDEVETEGVLFGVAPQHQSKGLYLCLMRAVQNLSLDATRRRMTVSTQVTNTAVQKAWCRLGYEPWRSVYTFHTWLKYD